MSANSKDALIQEARKIQTIISDYWAAPSVDSIEVWLEQFDREVRLPLATELSHILHRTYFPAKRVQAFLKSLITTSKLVGNDPASFWKKANFFTAQQRGHSQAELLEVFGALLKSQLGFGVDQCGSNGGPIIYIDDILFSGNRFVNDLRDWMPGGAPTNGTLHAIFIGIHSGGSFYANQAISQMARSAKKTLKVQLWEALSFENLSNSGAAADVYRMRSLPTDEPTRQYIKEHIEGEPKVMRPEKERNQSKFFSSEESRNLLEQVFWAKGLHIRDIAPNLKNTHRPLGYTSTNSANKLGFGSLVVTYRNCPNNCPLAYWVDDPWNPLFPRKTN